MHVSTVRGATVRAGLLVLLAALAPIRPGHAQGDLRAPAASDAAERSAARRAHTVVVDPGHGGPDRGMSGPARGAPRIYEKDITLQVSRRYAEALRRRGINVVMTRTTDTLIALADRGRIANKSKGDVFVSIHVNAANPNWKNASAARGFETYFLAEARTEDARRVAEMENASERYEPPVETSKNDPLSFIYTDMRQNEFLRESGQLADYIQRHLARIHPGPNRGVKQAGFKVLVTSFMPSVLVELGFGTNPAEARYLASPTEQARIAEALADATEAYLKQLDRKTGGTQ